MDYCDLRAGGVRSATEGTNRGVGWFIDWIDDSPQSPLYVDRKHAMSRGFLRWRFNSAPTPWGKLHSLLRGLFSEVELRRFVCENYVEIVDEIPASGSLLEVIDRVIPALSHAGLIDHRLFAALLLLKPQQAEVIRKCAEVWRIETLPAAETSPSSAADS